MLLASRRMQFGQPRQGKIGRGPKIFRSMSKNGDPPLIPETNQSPQNVPMVTLIAVLTTLPNKSEEKPSNSSSMSENDTEIFLQGKKSSQKMQMDLYNAVSKTLSGNFGQKGKNFLLKVRKWWINTFIKNKWFSSECSYGHVERSSDNPVIKCSTKLREFFGRCLKLIFNKHFSEENTSENTSMHTRKRCWQPSRGTFVWSLKLLHSMSDC